MPTSGLPVYNVVTDYGACNADGTDATYDINRAITDAANAGGGIVYLPVGVYKVGRDSNAQGNPPLSIALKSNVRIVGEVAQNNTGVRLKPYHPTTHVPVFKYESGSTYITGWSIENIAIDFSGCASSTTSSANEGDIGISISGCYLYDIQNVSIFHAYQAYKAYLTSGKTCFMGTVRKLYAKMCRFGIHHDQGTTMTFEHCWVNAHTGQTPDASYWKLGWHLGTIYGVTLTSCVLEKWYSSSTAPTGFYAENCRGLVINGMDVEGNDTNTGNLLEFNNCEVVLNAFRTSDNTVRCANGAISALIKAHSCSLSINGSSFGGEPSSSEEDRDIAVGGNAGSVAAALYLTSDSLTSAVAVHGCRIGGPEDGGSFLGTRAGLWNTADGFLDSLSVLATNGVQNQVHSYGDVLVIHTDCIEQNCERDTNRGFRVATGLGNVRAWLYGTGNNANHGGRLQLIDGGVIVAGLRIGSAGDPGYALHLTSDSAAKPSTSTWTVASDARTKENLRPFTAGLDVLRQLLLQTWEYNGLGDTPSGETASGVVAQEIQGFLPDAVVTTRPKNHVGDSDQAEYLGVN